MSGISLSLFARLRGRNVKIAIVYVESTLALEENFASDCRAELRNTIDADVAVFWLEVFGGHAEKRVDFMLGSLSDFPGRVGMFPAFDLRAEPERPSSSSDGPAALRCESERVISSVTNYLSRADISSIRTTICPPKARRCGRSRSYGISRRPCGDDGMRGTVRTRCRSAYCADTAAVCWTTSTATKRASRVWTRSYSSWTKRSAEGDIP